MLKEHQIASWYCLQQNSTELSDCLYSITHCVLPSRSVIKVSSGLRKWLQANLFIKHIRVLNGAKRTLGVNLSFYPLVYESVGLIAIKAK